MLNHTISELKQFFASEETSEFHCNPSFFRTTRAIRLPKQHHIGTNFEVLDQSQSGPRQERSIWKRSGTHLHLLHLEEMSAKCKIRAINHEI